MAIARGRSATTDQTIGENYETAFQAGSGGDGPAATTIEVECLTNSATWRVNGNREFTTDAGQTKNRRMQVGRIEKLEVKRNGSSDATVRWDVDAVML